MLLYQSRLPCCSWPAAAIAQTLAQPVANTKAPELVASWQTACITTLLGTTTTTQASGGSGGGGASGGEAYRSKVTFAQNGRVEFSTEKIH